VGCSPRFAWCREREAEEVLAGVDEGDGRADVGQEEAPRPCTGPAVLGAPRRRCRSRRERLGCVPCSGTSERGHGTHGGGGGRRCAAVVLSREKWRRLLSLEEEER
jgi:hypothetical protein